MSLDLPHPQVTFPDSPLLPKHTMYSNRKRFRPPQDAGEGSPLDGYMRIHLHADANDAQAPLIAEALILRSCSSIVKDLPADAQVLDLSTMLQDNGEPVQRKTVLTWLNCAYSRILDTPFSDELEGGEDMRCTAPGLATLLTFADAMGSTRGVLAACLSRLQDLVLPLQLPPEAQDRPPLDVRVHTDGARYAFERHDPDNGLRRLAVITAERDSWENPRWCGPTRCWSFRRQLLGRLRR